MSTFDPMAAAIDWLDAYRAHSPLIVNLYAEDAILECACGRQIVLFGRTTIAASSAIKTYMRYTDILAG